MALSWPTTPEISGFEVTTLVNQPHHLVGEAIGDFYRGHRRDDLTLLYFTGHGLKDDDGRLYLTMSNTRRDNLGFTSISAEQLDRAMESSRSRQVVLILDCCYSGAFPAGLLAKADTEVHALDALQARGRTVLTASDSMQYSFEGEQLHGAGVRSVFTRCLALGAPAYLNATASSRTVMPLRDDPHPPIMGHDRTKIFAHLSLVLMSAARRRRTRW